MEAISELLDQHRQALAADFKTSFNQLESKLNFRPSRSGSTADENSQRFSSFELTSEDLSQHVSEILAPACKKATPC